MDEPSSRRCRKELMVILAPNSAASFLYVRPDTLQIIWVGYRGWRNPLDRLDTAMGPCAVPIR